MVMEKAADTAARRGKKRRLRLEESADGDLPSSSVQLKTRRRLADEKTVNCPNSTCESGGYYVGLGSCCSSNGSSDLAEVQEEEDEVTVDQFLVTSNIDTLDLDRRERSETSCEIRIESGEMESTVRPNESNDLRRRESKMLSSDDDLEEFFSSAEKNLQKQFIDKYNYDVVKDQPLQGRFEWIQVKDQQP